MLYSRPSRDSQLRGERQNQLCAEWTSAVLREGTRGNNPQKHVSLEDRLVALPREVFHTSILVLVTIRKNVMEKCDYNEKCSCNICRTQFFFFILRDKRCESSLFLKSKLLDRIGGRNREREGWEEGAVFHH